MFHSTWTLSIPVLPNRPCPCTFRGTVTASSGTALFIGSNFQGTDFLPQAVNLITHERTRP